MSRRIFILIPVVFLILSLCRDAGAAGPGKGRQGMDIKVTSSAFKDGGRIPGKYGYGKENISVPLEWSDIPAGTQSIALICDDPDSPSHEWSHWVIFNIPPAATGLPEGVPASEKLESGAVQGMNDFKKIGYGGPWPPFGTHRYVFRLYALDSLLELDPGATRRDLLNAMKGRILGQGQLIGKYKK